MEICWCVNINLNHTFFLLLHFNLHWLNNFFLYLLNFNSLWNILCNLLNFFYLNGNCFLLLSLRRFLNLMNLNFRFFLLNFSFRLNFFDFSFRLSLFNFNLRLSLLNGCLLLSLLDLRFWLSLSILWYGLGFLCWDWLNIWLSFSCIGDFWLKVLFIRNILLSFNCFLLLGLLLWLGLGKCSESSCSLLRLFLFLSIFNWGLIFLLFFLSFSLVLSSFLRFGLSFTSFGFVFIFVLFTCHCFAYSFINKISPLIIYFNSYLLSKFI